MRETSTVLKVSQYFFCAYRLKPLTFFSAIEFLVAVSYCTVVGPGNRSPTATNIAVDLLETCYQVFNVLKLFHFSTDRN